MNGVRSIFRRKGYLLTALAAAVLLAASVTVDNVGADIIVDKTIIIDDTDTQTYVLSVPRGQTIIENGTFNIEFEADPPHYEGSSMISLRIADQDGELIRGYTANGHAPVRVAQTTEPQSLTAAAMTGTSLLL